MHGIESKDVLSLLELSRFRRMQLENYWAPRKDNFYFNIKNKTYDTPQNVFGLSFRYKQNYNDIWNLFKKFITSSTSLLSVSACAKYKRMRKDYVYREG